MQSIEWAQPALDDLRAIDAWLTDRAHPEIALRTLTSIRARALFLERFPRGGRPFGTDCRVLRVTDTAYLILYRIVGGDVQLLRIRHEREDWFVEP